MSALIYKSESADILVNLKEKGTTIVMVSHDIEFCAKYADRCAMFFDGAIVSENTPREFFSDKSFYTTTANRMARNVIPKAVITEDIIKALGGKIKERPRKEKYNSDKTHFFEKEQKVNVKKEKKKNISAIVFLFLDLTKRNKHFLIAASVFMFCAVVAYKFPNNFLYQFYGFLFFYGVFSFLIQGIAKKEKKDFLKSQKQKNIINKTAVVVKDIAKTLSIDGVGLIEFEDEIWQAKSIDDKEIKAGKQVLILSRENLILNVKEISCNAKD